MIDFEFNTDERKVLNIKLYEEDFDLIKYAIIIAIQNSQKHLQETSLDLETKNRIERKVFDCKKLLSKLDVCKLYNDDLI